MSTLRFHALKHSIDRQPTEVGEEVKQSEIFGANVFGFKTMRQFLTKEAFKSLMRAIDKGDKINRSIADQIASSMKDWAMAKGVTHYTHWFQPLTGATAEKHDAFFETLGNGDSLDDLPVWNAKVHSIIQQFRVPENEYPELKQLLHPTEFETAPFFITVTIWCNT